MTCTNVYSVSELTVLHLCTNNDKNGNPRRIYVLSHPLDGFLAAVDEGYSGIDALRDLAVGFEDDKSAILAQLGRRVSNRIEVTPSERKHLLSAPAQKEMALNLAIIKL